MINGLNRLSEDWNQISELVCYGYGRRATRLINRINRDFRICMVIDNDEKKQSCVYQGVHIQPFERVKDKLYGKKIIVTTGGGAYFSIKESMEKIGLVEYQDFCKYEDFLVEWYWKNQNKVVLSEVFMCITSRCTFRCKNCNQLMPYYTEKTHYKYTLDEIILTMDAFFSKVDELASFFIIGGEPLLHENLAEIIEQIKERYGEKIGYIQIITNGSIVPWQRLIDMIKRYQIDIRLSDYTAQIPYLNKYREVERVLKENGVEYSTSKYEKWFDVGIPGREKTDFETPETIRAHMIDCGPCHMIAEEKLYYCGTLFNAEKCGFTYLKSGDYCDLADPDISQEELLNYSLGNLKTDCKQTCGKCFGKSEKNPRVVKPAIQM